MEEKGLQKMKKADLIDIILRKDDVDRKKNAKLDELDTKLSASEKLIEELKNNTLKFKNEKDGVNRKLSEANTTINSLKRDRDSLINKNIRLTDSLKEAQEEIETLKDKGKVGIAMGIAGCVLIAVAVAIVLIF